MSEQPEENQSVIVVFTSKQRPELMAALSQMYEQGKLVALLWNSGQKPVPKKSRKKSA